MGMEAFIGSKNERLNSQLTFTGEIDRMTSVLRRTLLIDKSRRENDAEHSWHIAVMAMLFEEYAVEKVDVGRAAEMCVVHDLVEIYAGDTFAYDSQGNADKAERETADARYAACLDRIQPFLHNTLTDGHTWVEGGTNRAAVEKRMAIVKDFMPEVYKWISANIDRSVEKGWLREK